MKKTTTIEGAFARLGTTVSGRLHKFAMHLLKSPIMACSVLYFTPALLGDVWDIVSGWEIRMKPLFMFWGGMAYMSFLKWRRSA